MSIIWPVAVWGGVAMAFRIDVGMALAFGLAGLLLFGGVTVGPRSSAADFARKHDHSTARTFVTSSRQIERCRGHRYLILGDEALEIRGSDNERLRHIAYDDIDRAHLGALLVTQILTLDTTPGPPLEIVVRATSQPLREACASLDRALTERRTRS